MKKTRRILSLVLTVLMLMTSISVVSTSLAAPTTGDVIYVCGGANGTGISPDSPLGSISSAMQKLLAGGGGTIVLTGPVEITPTSTSVRAVTTAQTLYLPPFMTVLTTEKRTVRHLYLPHNGRISKFSLPLNLSIWTL